MIQAGEEDNSSRISDEEGTQKQDIHGLEDKQYSEAKNILYSVHEEQTQIQFQLASFGKAKKKRYENFLPFA